MSTVRGCFLTWNLSVDLIASRTSSLIERARGIYDSLGCITTPTFENTAQKLSLFEADYKLERSALDFPQFVHPVLEIREASVEADRKLSDLEIELEMRKDVFDRFVSLQAQLDSSISPQMSRYVIRKIRDGRRNGLHLDEHIRKRIVEISKEEKRLAIDFTHHMNEENTILEFSKDELAGCPDDFICSLVTAPSGKLQVTLKYPHYFPASEKASNPNTRCALEAAFNSRCAETNLPILKRLTELRKERATLLGFQTHADFMLETRMAKNGSNVAAFLKDIAQKLEPIRKKEHARLLELKKADCEQLHLNFVDHLEPWDMRYYMNLAMEKDYFVDNQKLKFHFPLHAVKSGVLRLYQHLLGLTFTRVDTPDLWHPSVEMFSVCDTETNALLGYFYLDLHPREGKFSHAAVFALQPGCLRLRPAASGEIGDTTERQVAVSAMVANFTPPTPEQPAAYMLHKDVETFFHEFGHLMHALCAEVDMALFSGSSVETDFVECPSQMLENWVWSKEGIEAIVGDEVTPIPPDLLQRLLNSRTANAGLFYARQVLLASFDQAIHTTRWNEDPQKVFAELCRELVKVDPTPGTCMPASFGHLADSYDARYYSYMWSLVFSADLYETRFRTAPDGGCLSASVGREYREKILKPGGSKDAIDMLRDFLGREPDSKAFFKLLGVDV